jgi:hypothetical protein
LGVIEQWASFFQCVIVLFSRYGKTFSVIDLSLKGINAVVGALCGINCFDQDISLTLLMAMISMSDFYDSWNISGADVHAFPHRKRWGVCCWVDFYLASSSNPLIPIT